MLFVVCESQRKIDARKYDMPLFKKDVQLLIDNAKTYNLEGSVRLHSVCAATFRLLLTFPALLLPSVANVAQIVVQDAEALGEVFKMKAAAANAKWKKDEVAADKAAEDALIEDPADVERREAMAVRSHKQ